MKNLLTVVGDGSTERVLKTAFLVAQRFASHITGLDGPSSEHARTFDLESGFYIYSNPARTRHHESDNPQLDGRSRFLEFMKEHGVPIATTARQGYDRPTASWLAPNTGRNLSVGMIGRVYDLVAISQPQNLTSVAGATLEDALFESGRPVLMVPKTSPTFLGDTIGIAWNGSTETAQTVALAMPFLQQAKRVVVIAVGSQHMPEPGPEGEELARMLVQEGITVSLRSAVGRHKRQGESFLHEAALAGVDLLLKGAYTRSRLRQAIFGGATRHIILESTIPVLMAR